MTIDSNAMAEGRGPPVCHSNLPAKFEHTLNLFLGRGGGGGGGGDRGKQWEASVKRTGGKWE